MVQMELSNLLILLFIALVGAGLFVLARRVQKGATVQLRPHIGYNALQKQVGRAVESGQRMHISLGRGNLASATNASSAAALIMLDQLAEGSCASSMPPTITTGDGTMLLAGQDHLREAFTQARRATEFQPGLVQLQASETFPIAYAAGVNHVIHRETPGSNVLIGRFGAEIALMTEAGEREQADQLISTDDPTALAIAYPVTAQLMIGEEHLAAGAYVQGKPAHIASLQLQDFLRWLVALALLLATFYSIITALVG